MKTKISILSIAFVALLLTTGTSAFATSVTIANGGSTTIGANNNTMEVVTSKNVTGVYNAPGDPATTYVLSLYHLNGKWEYGTGSSTGGLWKILCDSDPCNSNEPLAVGSAENSTFDTNVWQAL